MMRIGTVLGLVRYPVKSMAGTEMESAELGWNGLLGDRRFAFRRGDVATDFPWLTANRLPALLTYRPCGFDESSAERLPNSVRTPGGGRLDLRSEELRRELSELSRSSLQLTHLDQGIFDETAISIITTATVERVCLEAGVAVDARRFRANILLECIEDGSFCEDDWLNGILVFGNGDMAAAVRVTKRDERCMMINLDPDTTRQDPNVLKAAVRLNENNAGVYAAVLRTGIIRAGDPVLFEPAPV